VINSTADFDKEQTEILSKTDSIKYDKKINRNKKHREYVEILETYIGKHLPDRFQIVKFKLINECGKFDLIMVKKGSEQAVSENAPCYELASIASVVKIAGHGLVNKKDELEGDVKSIKARFEKIKAENSNVKTLYLTLEERKMVSKGTNYDNLSKQHLGLDFFSLRDSTTHVRNSGEWERFIKALLAPS
jgi:hypothetical protein